MVKVSSGRPLDPLDRGSGFVVVSKNILRRPTLVSIAHVFAHSSKIQCIYTINENLSKLLMNKQTTDKNI